MKEYQLVGWVTPEGVLAHSDNAKPHTVDWLRKLPFTRRYVMLIEAGRSGFIVTDLHDKSIPTEGEFSDLGKHWIFPDRESAETTLLILSQSNGEAPTTARPSTAGPMPVLRVTPTGRNVAPSLAGGGGASEAMKVIRSLGVRGPGYELLIEMGAKKPYILVSIPPVSMASRGFWSVPQVPALPQIRFETLAAAEMAIALGVRPK